MSTRTWKVTAEPVGRFWHITVDGLGGATQARSVKEIDAMARDFISAKTESSPTSFDIFVQVQLPQKVRHHLAQANELREVSDRTRKEAAEESRQAARALRDQGLTVRDIGFALGISFQRAQQLVKG